MDVNGEMIFVADEMPHTVSYHDDDRDRTVSGFVYWQGTDKIRIESGRGRAVLVPASSIRCLDGLKVKGLRRGDHGTEQCAHPMA